MQNHKNTTSVRLSYESVYMYLKVFSSTLTYSLPTYRESLLITIKDTSTYLPQIKFHPNRSNPVPTYLVHSTHLTRPHTYQYYITIYTGVRESAGR